MLNVQLADVIDCYKWEWRSNTLLPDSKIEQRVNSILSLSKQRQHGFKNDPGTFVSLLDSRGMSHEAV